MTLRLTLSLYLAPQFGLFAGVALVMQHFGFCKIGRIDWVPVSHHSLITSQRTSEQPSKNIQQPAKPTPIFSCSSQERMAALPLMIRRAAVRAQSAALRSFPSRDNVSSLFDRTPNIKTFSSARLIHQQKCGCDIKRTQSSIIGGRRHHRTFSSISSSNSKTLKKVVRPFLVACHPDLMHAAEAEDKSEKKKHSLSNQAKDVNLKAVQTINGLIDNLEDLIERCTPTAGDKSAGSLPELKAKYEIEFILPSQSKDDYEGNKPRKKKHYERESLTLRSITIEFPEKLRSSVRKWALTSFPDRSKFHTDPEYQPHPQEEEAFRVAINLRQHATAEFLRLLTISGMEVPKSAIGGMHENSRSASQLKDESRWSLSDHFLHEMGINPMETVTDDQSSQQQTSAFFGRMKPNTAPSCSYSKMQQKRQAFMQRVPWDQFRKNYDQAFLDAQADWTTAQLDLFNPKTAEGRERRERLVSEICSNVRIVRAKQEGVLDDDDDEFDDIPEGLDVVAQLIAIRRLNLILYDNFDYLQMEKMGRMWENLGVVLLPPRGERRRSQREKDPRHANAIHPGRKLNKWERRLKRREKMKPVSRGQMRHVAETHFNKMSSNESEADRLEKEKDYFIEQESGFKFSYGTRSDQGSGHVTAYVPVDFGDEELVRQLYSHLYDYFDNCCGDTGFLNYGADGEVSANLTRDIEQENSMGTNNGNTNGEEKMRSQ